MKFNNLKNNKFIYFLIAVMLLTEINQLTEEHRNPHIEINQYPTNSGIIYITPAAGSGMISTGIGNPNLINIRYL